MTQQNAATKCPTCGSDTRKLWPDVCPTGTHPNGCCHACDHDYPVSCHCGDVCDDDWHREPAAPPEGETDVDKNKPKSAIVGDDSHTRTLHVDSVEKAVVSPAMSAEQFYSQKLPRGEINNFLSYEIADDPSPEYQRTRIFQFAEAYARHVVAALTAEKPGAPPAKMTAAELEAEWLAQSEHLDYRNWLQAHVIHLRGEVERLTRELDKIIGACATIGLHYYPGSMQLHNERAEQAEAEIERLREQSSVIEENLADYARRLFDLFSMYERAWLREMGGVIVPKSHTIDGFVLRMRGIYEKAQLVDRIKQIMVNELKKKVQGEEMFDSVFKMLAKSGRDKVPTN